eukprot:g25855.t1
MPDVGILLCFGVAKVCGLLAACAQALRATISRDTREHGCVYIIVYAQSTSFPWGQRAFFLVLSSVAGDVLFLYSTKIATILRVVTAVGFTAGRDAQCFRQPGQERGNAEEAAHSPGSEEDDEDGEEGEVQDEQSRENGKVAPSSPSSVVSDGNNQDREQTMRSSGRCKETWRKTSTRKRKWYLLQ